MTTPPLQAPAATSVLGWWLCYCVSLTIPAYALAFLCSGPHTWWGALLWLAGGSVFLLADMYGPKQRREPPPVHCGLPFDGLLYALALCQIATVYAVCEMASDLRWEGRLSTLHSMIDLMATRVLAGGSSSVCGIVVGHELIHRRNFWQRRLGRLLLVLGCYEHFATEHLAGHHRRVGTTADPATARYGETFDAYLRRTVPAQFRSAFHLESRRLRLAGYAGGWRFWRRHRVLQGALAELALVAAIAAVWGVFALVAFVLQAYSAICKLEAINYVEHWGLHRRSGQVGDADSWESCSWFTVHGVIGLARHADHHQRPALPYYRLAYRPHSPQLPYGYFAMVYYATLRNDTFQHMARRELEARGLAPTGAEAQTGAASLPSR